MIITCKSFGLPGVRRAGLGPGVKRFLGKRGLGLGSTAVEASLQGIECFVLAGFWQTLLQDPQRLRALDSSLGELQESFRTSILTHPGPCVRGIRCQYARRSMYACLELHTDQLLKSPASCLA